MGKKLIKRMLYSGFALIGGFGLGLTLFGESPVLAGLCPPCYGFDKVGENLYLAGANETETTAFQKRHEIASARVTQALGPFEPPRILACASSGCNTRMGGHQTRGLTYGVHLIYLGPTGLETAILAHEMAHIKIHRDIGLGHLTDFPTWVDEGMAVVISRDDRFDLDPESCEPGEGELPVSAKSWRRSEDARNGRYYAMAGCRIAKWFDENPSKTYTDLIALHHPAQ